MRQVGPFVLGGVLGSGAQGEVRRAVHAPTGTPVAVKLARGPADGFAAEFETLADLDHPHVVRLWGAGVAEGRRWFAMELARTTLAAAPPSEWGTLRGMLERLLGALGHVHARGILHLDVKPANVLLGCEDGPDELEPEGLAGLRLSDFGLSGSVVAPKVAGTVGYAAPEQLAGRWRELSPATDLFALGELAWQLATGRLRHDGDAVAVHRAQLRREGAPFEPRLPVPRGLREWLEWLLHPAATARPQRAIEALDALPDDLLPGRLPAPALSEATTWVESEPLDGAPAAGAAAARGEPPARPWRVREVWGRVRWLEGGGLGPLHTRRPRFVGRDAERERLWGLLQGVRATGRPAAVRVTGAPGHGASRLAAWLGGRAHEADQAVVLQYGPGDDLARVLRRAARAEGLDGPPLHERLRLAGAEWGFPREVCQALSEVVADGADPLPLIRRLPRARPLLILHDDPTWMDAWNPVLAALLAEDRAPVFVVLVSARADTPGDVLTVGALGMSDVDPLLDRWMGLSRPLADGVLVASGGVPGRLVALLGDLDRAGALRSTADGFVADGPLPEAAPFAPPDADPPTPPPSVRAWDAARAGRLDEARAAIDELVWRRQPVDLAAVALALTHRDPEHPATVLLPLRLAGRRGLLRGLVALAEEVAGVARARGWALVEASADELRSWALTAPDPEGALRAAVEAEARHHAAGDVEGAARCRRRQASFALRRRDRERLLAPDLEHPAHRSTTLLQLCVTDPLQWADALRDAPLDDPWLAPERDRALAEAASLSGDHARALQLCVRATDTERFRTNRVWAEVLRMTTSNVHRRRGDADEALRLALGVMAGDSPLKREEAALMAAGVCFARGDLRNTRRLLAGRPRHPLPRVLHELLGFGVDLAEGRAAGAASRWEALWATHAGLAESVWVSEWWPVVRAHADRLGLGLSWPLLDP